MGYSCFEKNPYDIYNRQLIKKDSCCLPCTIYFPPISLTALGVPLMGGSGTTTLTVFGLNCCLCNQTVISVSTTASPGGATPTSPVTATISNSNLTLSGLTRPGPGGFSPVNKPLYVVSVVIGSSVYPGPCGSCFSPCKPCGGTCAPNDCGQTYTVIVPIVA